MSETIANRYELIREVGRGGMGAVWLARDIVLGRDVALKQLASPEAVGTNTARAEREAQLAARLNHRHVVAVFDLVDHRGRPWLVMEYVPGTTLSGYVAHHGPLPADRAARLVATAADGLLAAHRAGIVHRDVKPSNLLVNDHVVKLTDFGIARGTGADLTLTQTGLVTGSPAYLSPEAASGQTATPASDVWGLGATFYFALTGTAPYPVEDNVLGALYRIVNEEPPRTPLAGPYAAALAGAMTRDPAHRWTLEQFRDELRSPTKGGAAAPPAPEPDPVTETTPAIAPEPTPRKTPRRSAAIIAAVVTLVAIATAGGLLLGLQRGGSSAASDGSSPRSSAPQSSAPPSSEAPSPSESPSQTPSPTADEVRAFATDYLHTAADDPASGFAMLTPEFQEASGGMSGYRGWWDSVSSVDAIERVEARMGDDLGVSYRYTYTMADGSTHTEDVSLDLVFQDGRYLIAG